MEKKAHDVRVVEVLRVEDEAHGMSEEKCEVCGKTRSASAGWRWEHMSEQVQEENNMILFRRHDAL